MHANKVPFERRTKKAMPTLRSESCANCAWPLRQDWVRFQPPPHFDIVSRECWCSPGCCLAFAKDLLAPVEFLKLRTDLGSYLGTTLYEKPSRYTLLSNGGSLSLEQYHGPVDWIAMMPTVVHRNNRKRWRH